MAAPPALPSKNSSPADSPASPAPSPKAPRLPRYIKRQNHARAAGLACLEQRGLDHYRHMSALAREAKRALPPKPKRTRRCQYTLPREMGDFIRAVALQAGVTPSAIVSEAIDAFVLSVKLGHVNLGCDPFAPGAAGRKPPTSKRPKPRKP